MDMAKECRTQLPRATNCSGTSQARHRQELMSAPAVADFRRTKRETPARQAVSDEYEARKPRYRRGGAILES
jgi:hypothetical protein